MYGKEPLPPNLSAHCLANGGNTPEPLKLESSRLSFRGLTPQIAGDEASQQLWASVFILHCWCLGLFTMSPVITIEQPFPT